MLPPKKLDDANDLMAHFFELSPAEHNTIIHAVDRADDVARDPFYESAAKTGQVEWVDAQALESLDIYVWSPFIGTVDGRHVLYVDRGQARLLMFGPRAKEKPAS